MLILSCRHIYDQENTIANFNTIDFCIIITFSFVFRLYNKGWEYDEREIERKNIDIPTQQGLLVPKRAQILLKICKVQKCRHCRCPMNVCTISP